MAIGKSKSKRARTVHLKSRRAANGTPKRPAQSKSAPASNGGALQAGLSKAPASSSKQDAVLAMLRLPKGTTIAAIMKAMNWQQHSVRGFLAGVIRKKLKLDLISEKVDGQRIYRIGKSGAVR